ncbi:Chemotaxis protein CheY [Novipirellula galeiformis]|uniref:Chemotaxis protein CheY n=1 Tax=Novipirellula galeiformis TaxID=2528004 RepID=A0A5C6CBW0_9BACT|nr:response regulator [Novipirellula galeiformis]TWU21572.1 Chemotaxis protein CheY [Novipirellula galeiformis]
MKDQHRILVVDDSATQLTQIRMLLESSGYEVSVASDGVQALASVKERLPDLVLTDLQMPNMDGLELVREITLQQLPVPVILTTAAGSELIAAQALHAGAASYVPKSAIATILLPTVRRVLELQVSAQTNQLLASCLHQTEVTWALVNDQSLVPDLIGSVESILNQMSDYDPGQHMQIAMALDEAIVNAMVHGNLEIASELKCIEDGQPYLDKIQERLADPAYSNRRVHFSLRADRHGAVFTIRDEGPGFNLSDVPDPTDPSNLDKEGGRGLLLINTFMDEVKHNEKGNEITMVKLCVNDSPVEQMDEQMDEESSM